MLVLAGAVALAGGAGSALLGDCGPFSDVSPAFCAAVFEVYVLGVTAGTSPTTYSPDDNVSRLQMAPFLKRAVDTTLLRGSRRTALDQFWTTQTVLAEGLTSVGGGPYLPKSDGMDVWVPSIVAGSVSRVRASDGKLLDTWTGANLAAGALVAMGRVFVTGASAVGALYVIDPTAPGGAVTTVSGSLGGAPQAIAFDGGRIWTANGAGSVSIVTPGPTLPWGVTTVATGFSHPTGIVYDGSNIWVTDSTAGTLLKLDANGAVLKTVTTGGSPAFAAFDGTNIWVPNFNSNSLTVVRASTASVVGTPTGNGLSQPYTVAFDGQRVLVTNQVGSSVSLWKAADLSPLGSFPLGGTPSGVCSDGIHFFIAISGIDKLARF